MRVFLLPFVTVFSFWSIYRALFTANVWLEEILIKGTVFCLPFVMFPLRKKLRFHAVGMTTFMFFKSVYWGIFLGMALGFVGIGGNLLRHGSLLFSDYGLSSGKVGAFIILSLITAFWEQLLFTGYLLLKIAEYSKNEWVQVGWVGVLFSFIHVPAYIFVQKMEISQLLVSVILLFLLGAAAAILKLRQQNLIAPIMAHALWGITIYMFR